MLKFFFFFGFLFFHEVLGFSMFLDVPVYDHLDFDFMTGEVLNDSLADR